MIPITYQAPGRFGMLFMRAFDGSDREAPVLPYGWGFMRVLSTDTLEYRSPFISFMQTFHEGEPYYTYRVVERLQ